MTHLAYLRARPRCWWGSRSDRGSAESLFILPVLFVMVLIIAVPLIWYLRRREAKIL